jgi:hypothetical protein
MSATRALGLFELFARGIFRQGDQDLGNVIVDLAAARGLVSLQPAGDLSLRDGDLCHHVALPDSVDGHLPAHGFAEGGVIDALRRQCLGQLGKGNPIALGDPLQGHVELFVPDADAEPLGPLQLHLLDDQRLEDLLSQGLWRRHARALLAQLARHHLEMLVDLRLQHDAFIDHGYDAVQELPGFAQRCRLHAAPQQPERAAQDQVKTYNTQ